MKLIFNNQAYIVNTEDNSLVTSFEKILPLTLRLSRSAEHEYYTSLPAKITVEGAEVTSHVNAGWVYYFEAWNAIALNFKGTDISPYKVYVVGRISGGLEKILSECGSVIEIKIEE